MSDDLDGHDELNAREFREFREWAHNVPDGPPPTGHGPRGRTPGLDALLERIRARVAAEDAMAAACAPPPGEAITWVCPMSEPLSPEDIAQRQAERAVAERERDEVARTREIQRTAKLQAVIDRWRVERNARECALGRLSQNS